MALGSVVRGLCSVVPYSVVKTKKKAMTLLLKVVDVVEAVEVAVVRFRLLPGVAAYSLTA